MCPGVSLFAGAADEGVFPDLRDENADEGFALMGAGGGFAREIFIRPAPTRFRVFHDDFDGLPDEGLGKVASLGTDDVRELVRTCGADVSRQLVGKCRGERSGSFRIRENVRVVERKAFQESLCRDEVPFGFAGKSRHQIAAESEIRHKFPGEGYDFVDILRGIGTPHGSQRRLGAGLDGEMEESADVRMLGHRADGLDGAGAGFDGSEAITAGWGEVGQRGEEVREAFPVRAIE